MLRIIIADDHTHVRKGIIEMLQEEFPSENMYIGEAANGEILLEKVLAEEWDLVISDLVMPGLSGLDALKRIKQERKNLPVLIISTHPVDPYRAHVLLAGADDFISKDTFPTLLIQAVHRILDTEMNTTNSG